MYHSYEINNNSLSMFEPRQPIKKKHIKRLQRKMRKKHEIRKDRDYVCRLDNRILILPEFTMYSKVYLKVC